MVTVIKSIMVTPPGETSMESFQFILSHFKGQEFVFPRSIMTLKTNGQVVVDSQEKMIKFFKESNFIDCRINGYPLYPNENSKKIYPSLVFIDLDLTLCSTCKYPIRKLDYILGQTLHKIKEDVNGQPTVLWTGGGYHIYQPFKIVTIDREKQPLKVKKELENFIPLVRNDICTEFIRFAAKYLTLGKGDPKHNPSIYSCLIRVPGSINSKYNEEVKIIQKWDGIEANADPLITPFFNSLIQKKIENDQSFEKENGTNIRNKINTIAWIEKLLVTPIEDHRYFCLWHILIPYLKNIRGLPKHEVIIILTNWLNECDKLAKVRWSYPQRIKDQIRYDKGYPPISLENLKKENKELYNLVEN